MTATLTKALAQKFIERSEALGLKGKKRDDAALDFWCGAASALELSGRKLDADTLGRQAALIVAVRGYFGVREMANMTLDAERAAVILQPELAR